MFWTWQSETLLEDYAETRALRRREFGVMGRSSAAGREKFPRRMQGWTCFVLLVGAILLATLPGESLARILLAPLLPLRERSHPCCLQGAEARRP